MTTDLRAMERRLRLARQHSMLVLAATNDPVDRPDPRTQRPDGRRALTQSVAIEEEINRIIAEQEQVTLLAIDAAIERLHARPGDFGRCEVCGEAIPDERMAVAPWVSRCETHGAHAHMV